MLIEMRCVRQEPKEGFRRWFADENLDLIVWYKPDRTFYGFQLCYDKDGHEKALTWLDDTGYAYDGVDSGEESPWDNRSPMLVPTEQLVPFEKARVLSQFRASDKRLPVELRRLVRQKIRAFRAGLSEK